MHDAKLHTAYSAFQDATNLSIVDSQFVQGHQEIPPETRNQTKWPIEGPNRTLHFEVGDGI